MLNRLLVVLSLFFSCSEEAKKISLAPSKIAVDKYHGQKIEDPYRNLENLEDSIVMAISD